jgi:hypothetical protein
MSKERRPKPDDAFEVPGVFRMDRHGRFISIDTHRTPAQQRELMKRLSEGRPRLREEIVKLTGELTSLIHKFRSLDLLANLVVVVGLNGEQRDCEAHIEHLALLELKDREYQLRGLECQTALLSRKLRNSCNRSSEPPSRTTRRRGLIPIAPDPLTLRNSYGSRQ